MSTQNNHKQIRVPLQQYWTTRYVMTLFTGLLFVAIVSAIWIRHSNLEHRLEVMDFMAEEIANRFMNVNEKIPSDEEVQAFLSNQGRFTNMESNPYLYIATADGTILSSNRLQSPMEYRIHPAIINNDKERQKISLDGAEDYYVIKKPITYNSLLLGWVVIADTEKNLTRVNQEYNQLLWLIAILAILGWAAIYFLTKKLARPIKEVARAARQVQEGNYNIQLSSNEKIEEVNELIHSFKEMSQQLEHLESLRNELLAGVTHELKTPVTSISGLLQAVNDEVVTGEEAKEFLNISLMESTKMKKMVEDLLAFNAFQAKAVPLTMKPYLINEVVHEIVYQWEVAQKDPNIQIEAHLLHEDREVRIDALRLQQILTNLLNNAQHAMENQGKIEIFVRQSSPFIMIDVTDTGAGIPKEEQPFIFERFYRGEEKKYKVGGLGLGLTYSKMIAQAMKGDLELLSSSPQGTTFRIKLLTES